VDSTPPCRPELSGFKGAAPAPEADDGWVLLARSLAAKAVRYTGRISTSAHPAHPNLLDSSGEPSNLAEWTEFHERVEALPEAEREVVGLLWYEGVSQEEAAALLGVSLRTVKRRWLALAKQAGQTVLGLFGSLKNIAERLRESFRQRRVPEPMRSTGPAGSKSGSTVVESRAVAKGMSSEENGFFCPGVSDSNLRGSGRGGGGVVSPSPKKPAIPSPGHYHRRAVANFTQLGVCSLA
jgi:hypothetical protein